MVELKPYSDDWVINMGELCSITPSQKKLLTDEVKLLELINSETRLKDTTINQIVSDLPFDISKSFTKIISHGHKIPHTINTKDIYLYFVKNLLICDISDYWNQYYIGDNGIPERMLETLICRVELNRECHDKELEVLRYTLLYVIFNFYYNNIEYLKQYIRILRVSLVYNDVIQKNKMILEYITSVANLANDLIESHIKIIKNSELTQDYSSYLTDIVNIFKYIVILEKTCYMLLMGKGLCVRDMYYSTHNINKSLYDKYFNEIVHNATCVCDKIKLDSSINSKYISNLQKINNSIILSIKNKAYSQETFKFS